MPMNQESRSKENVSRLAGQLLVEAIMTTGINIDNKFIVSIENGKAKVTVNGEINATSGTFSGFLKIPFKTFKEGAIPNAATGEIYRI